MKSGSKISFWWVETSGDDENALKSQEKDECKVKNLFKS